MLLVVGAARLVGLGRRGVRWCATGRSARPRIVHAGWCATGPTRHDFPVGQTTRIVDRNGRETAPRLEREYPNAIARLRLENLIKKGAIQLRLMIYKSMNIKTSSPGALRSLLKLEMHAPSAKGGCKILNGHKPVLVTNRFLPCLYCAKLSYNKNWLG